MLGEVPIRDFMAYDPGRYYWSAGLMSLWHDNSIMAWRFSLALLQAVGLFIGLSLIAHGSKKQNFLYLTLSAVTLGLCMTCREGMFNASVSLLLVGALAFLVQSPTGRRYFFAGLCIGLAAFFGRNYGVYGVVGSLGGMFWLSIKRTGGPGFVKGVATWALGIVVGFSPIIFMALLVPGFAAAFWASIRFLIKIKATNISLPITWPWQVRLHSNPVPLSNNWDWLRRLHLVSLAHVVHDALIGLFFIAIVVFGVLSIAWVIWQKIHSKPVSPALVATAFLVLPYAHYAYSRADVPHLEMALLTFLVGCFAFLATQSAKIKWPLALVLCAASLTLALPYHPGMRCLGSKRCVQVEISGNDIHVLPSTASDIRLLRKLSEQYAPNGRSFIVSPFWPGAYALLARKAPMWETYQLFSRSAVFEKAEIQRIKASNPGFALVIDLPLDGRDDLRFRSTHPLTYRYIVDNFDPIRASKKPAYLVYKAKKA